MLWSYDPKRSEQRRRRKADPPDSG
jgi:hypothetical protein